MADKEIKTLKWEHNRKESPFVNSEGILPGFEWVANRMCYIESHAVKVGIKTALVTLHIQPVYIGGPLHPEFLAYWEASAVLAPRKDGDIPESLALRLCAGPPPPPPS